MMEKERTQTLLSFVMDVIWQFIKVSCLVLVELRAEFQTAMVYHTFQKASGYVVNVPSRRRIQLYVLADSIAESD